jgi:hypothetical protein
MRALVWIVLAAALLWSGWWVFGSRAALKGAETAFAAAPGAGWEASNAGIGVAGFPNRFDLTLTEPSVARGGWGWRGPFLQVLALAYKPHHLILVFPPTQTLTLPRGEAAVAAADMKASIVLDPTDLSAGPSVDRIALVGTTVTAAGLHAGTLQLGLRRLSTEPPRYEAGAELLELALPPALHPPQRPASGARAHIDGVVTLAAPLDRNALATIPAIVRIEIAEATVTWGPLSASATGTLEPDAQGRAAGAITLRLSDPAAAGALLADLGLVPRGTVPPRDLSLTLAGGRIRLLRIDLGPAPRLLP